MPRTAVKKPRATRRPPTRAARGAPKKKAKKVSLAVKAATKSRAKSAARNAAKLGGITRMLKASRNTKAPSALPGTVNLDMPIPPIAEAIDLVPFAQLAESALNPRHDFDEGKLWELARSIANDGVLQNLVARETDLPDVFEIVSGARRYRAVAMLVAEGKVTPQYKLPVRIIECSDVELIRKATVENIQRADMHPLEEGECFRALRKQGDTTENIANLIGKSQRWVQKRIDLVEKLSDPVKAKFRADAITVWQAEAIAKAEPKRQATLVTSLQRGFIKTAKDIVEAIAEDKPPVKAALFDRALYTGAIIAEDDDDPKSAQYFTDAAQFDALQTEAIAAKKKELAAKWAWVEIVPKNAYFSEHNFERSSNPKKAGAVIKIGHDFEVEIFEGLVARGKISPHASPAAKKLAKKSADAKKQAEEDGDDTPNVQLTQPLMIYARNRKGEAMQHAVAFDGGYGGRAAMVMVMLGLLKGNDCLKIRRDDIRKDDHVISSFVMSELDRVTAAIGDLMAEPGNPDDPDYYGPSRSDPRNDLALKSCEDALEAVSDRAFEEQEQRLLGVPAEAFRRLWTMPIEELTRLFAIVVAAFSGTFVNYQPDVGDSPLAQAIASALDIDMANHWSPTGWDSYLPLCKKGRLVRLCCDMPALMIAPSRAAKMKTAALVMEITQTLDAKPELKRQVPIELTFTTKRAIEDAMTAAVNAPDAGSHPAPDAKGPPATEQSASPAASAKKKPKAAKAKKPKAANKKAALRAKANGHAAGVGAE